MSVSGFTFVHNAIEGGYPIVEAIEAVYPFVDDVLVVDMESTDGTMDIIGRACSKLGLHCVFKRQGEWTPGAAGECLRKAHTLHRHCKGDVIVHFEADEVFSPSLMEEIHRKICSYHHMSVWRLQVEQNFQRIRWYPELVHRVFPNDGSVTKGIICDGLLQHDHTTNIHIECPDSIYTILPDVGFLWDCSSTFRDNLIARCGAQSELWGDDHVVVRLTPNHFNDPYIETSDMDFVRQYLQLPHWTWKTTPIALPHNLAGMVGDVSYREHLERRGLI